MPAPTPLSGAVRGDNPGDLPALDTAWMPAFPWVFKKSDQQQPVFRIKIQMTEITALPVALWSIRPLPPQKGDNNQLWFL